jgi:hypothetical protein
MQPVPKVRCSGANLTELARFTLDTIQCIRHGAWWRRFCVSRAMACTEGKQFSPAAYTHVLVTCKLQDADVGRSTHNCEYLVYLSNALRHRTHLVARPRVLCDHCDLCMIVSCHACAHCTLTQPLYSMSPGDWCERGHRAGSPPQASRGATCLLAPAPSHSTAGTCCAACQG